MKAERSTFSVCPSCLRQLPARLAADEQGRVWMEKTCPEHGPSRVPVWRGLVDMESWRAGAQPLDMEEALDCAHCKGLCGHHQRASCCVLLEVTSRCNLACRYCFADKAGPEPSLEELKRAVDVIARDGNRPLLILSGGEPAQRDDLPELVAYARRSGCPYVQLNSNGLRLAEDGAYTRALAQAGLSFVFLQFDGVDDDIYRTLRGRPLLRQKIRAIEACDRHRLGVTLTPTVVPGVNDGHIGTILRFAAGYSPAVRGVHFQPVSYFGRYPAAPGPALRFTLDDLLAALEKQGGLAPGSIGPSRCDHPLCGCHGSFFVGQDGGLVSLAAPGGAPCCETTAEQNREYIATRWRREGEPLAGACCCEDVAEAACPPSLDDFLQRAKSHSFTVTAMAFQDAQNLDVERLRRCSLHVYHGGVLKPFCAHYLTPMEG